MSSRRAPCPRPAALLAEIPKTEAQADFVTRSRQDIHRLIFTDDRRLLLIVGPCSIHDVDAGREYARRLAALAREVSDRVMIVMRVYFEKPRTIGGLEGPDHGPAPRRVATTSPRACGSPGASCATCSTSGCRRPRSSWTRSPRSTSPTLSAGPRSARAPPSRRPTARWPRASPCRSASRTGRTARCRPRSTRSAPRPSPRPSSASTSRAPPPRSSRAGNPNCHIVLRGGSSGPNYSAGAHRQDRAAARGRRG